VSKLSNITSYKFKSEYSGDVLMGFAKSLLTISIGKLVLGAGLGQIVSFLAAPIIARLYGPQSFGEQAAILSVVAPLVAVSSMAFPIAIVIARTDGEALSLSRLAFFGTLVLAPLATVFLFLEDMWLLNRLGLEAIGTYAILVPIIALLTTANMSAGYIMTRNSAFGRSAWSSVSAAIAGNLTKVGLGLIWPGTLSLIIGNAVGYLVASIFAFKLRRSMAHGAPHQTLNDLREVACEHRDFPLLRAPQIFVASVSMSIPVLALTASFGVESAGFYAIALAIAGAPVSLIGSAVQSVLYPTVRITIPWNLDLGAGCAVGDHAILYALGKITVGPRATISQYAHLCSGSHDLSRNDRPLTKPPITIEADAWIATDAFVGPGVHQQGCTLRIPVPHLEDDRRVWQL
jgi:hypothetical protein